MTAIQDIWSSILAALSPILSPDWGSLVGLIPFLILGLVILFLVWVTTAWWRLNRSLPDAIRPRAGGRTVLVLHAMGILLGIALCATAFLTGGSAADGTLGLVVNLPLLLLGLAIAVSTAASGALRWERVGSSDEPPDGAELWVHAHRRGVSITLQFLIGVLITAAGLLLLPPPDAATGVQPVASVPLLVIGLVVAIAAVARAIMAVWPSGDDAPEMAALEAGAGSSHPA